MARRKFEMFQYRQALVRMRQGDSDRQIAGARIMGRRTAARLRELALQRNWLDANAAMPEDEAISTALGQPKRASTTITTIAQIHIYGCPLKWQKYKQKQLPKD